MSSLIPDSIEPYVALFGGVFFLLCSVVFLYRKINHHDAKISHIFISIILAALCFYTGFDELANKPVQETVSETVIETIADTVEEVNTTTIEPTTTTEVSSESTEVARKFACDVLKIAIDGCIGEDEIINDVMFIKNDLHVYIDLRKPDDEPYLAILLLVQARTSSITDKILTYKKFDDLWDTITVSFSSYGYVTNKKIDIQKNEFGGRYFSIDDFILVEP